MGAAEGLLTFPAPRLFSSLSARSPLHSASCYSTTAARPGLIRTSHACRPAVPLIFPKPPLRRRKGSHRHDCPAPTLSVSRFHIYRALTLRRLSHCTTKLAGLYIHKFSFVRPLLGPKAWVHGGDYKKPP